MIGVREEIPLSPSKDRTHPCPELGCRLFSEQWPDERRYFHIAQGQGVSEAVYVMPEWRFRQHHLFSFIEEIGNWMRIVHDYEEIV